MTSKNYIFEQYKEFDEHQMIVFFHHLPTMLRGFIAIHRRFASVPSFGATRMWYYQNDVDAIRDTLRLSKLMSYKSALAGLPYGGAKATIMLPLFKEINRDELLRQYVRSVNALGGTFVTGADVGVNENDLKYMRSFSRHIVGLKNDAVYYTALGAFFGIKTALKEIFGSDDIHERTFAIQGLGKTGHALLDLLYKDAKKIYVSDINEDKMQEIKKNYPKVTTIKPLDIHKQHVDVFSPCALSNSINVKTISQLHCKIVAGIANSQLENDQMGELLHKLGILYAPDYIINAGGLMTVVDEYENTRNNEQRIVKKVEKIGSTLQKIIDESKANNRPMSTVADETAKKIINENNG